VESSLSSIARQLELKLKLQHKQQAVSRIGSWITMLKAGGKGQGGVKMQMHIANEKEENKKARVTHSAQWQWQPAAGSVTGVRR